MTDLDRRPARMALLKRPEPWIEPPREPARSRQGPQGDVIEDARARQRRRRRRYALTVLLAAIAGALIAYAGHGGGSQGNPHQAAGGGFRSAGNGISARVPHGWHLYRPPITSTTYPYDRALLTSYPAATGGQCGPTKAERALPSNGALIYLTEYASAPTGIASEPTEMRFPRLSSNTVTPHGQPQNYECSATPSYIVRFKTAGRLMQATLAFGSSTTAARRAEATRILTELRAH